jgi:hypothetical protein
VTRRGWRCLFARGLPDDLTSNQDSARPTRGDTIYNNLTAINLPPANCTVAQTTRADGDDDHCHARGVLGAHARVKR